MKFNGLDLDLVAKDLKRREDLLKQSSKKRTMTIAESILFPEQSAPDIDLYQEQIKAVAKEKNELACIVGTNDLLDTAHPGGSFTLPGVETSGDLSVVENLEGQHEKILSVVRKEVSDKALRIAKEVFSLANKLDSNGFRVMADRLDKQATILIRAEDYSVGDVKITSEIDSFVPRLQENLALFAGEFSAFSNSLSEHNKRTSEIKLQKTLDSFDSFKRAFDNFDFAKAEDELSLTRDNLSSVWDSSAEIHQLLDSTLYNNTLSIMKSVFDLINLEENKVAIENDAKEKPAVSNEPVEVPSTKNVSKKKKVNHRKFMMEVQKKINKLINKMGLDPIQNEVPETGNPADSETYETLKRLWNIVPGTDFKNWKQLLSKLDEKSREIDEKPANNFPPVGQPGRNNALGR